MALISNGRTIFVDSKFDSEVNNENYSNILFQRLSAKNIRFNGVDFKYTIFDNCYFRNCFFDSCDFTGCKFVACNLPSSHFEGCKFDYCNFERTFIESEILENSAPGYDNLKQKFARSLRLNYQSIGDSKSVNKAILYELAAEKEHLLKAWSSNESYYRSKYKNLKRVAYFFEWLNFRFLDFVWGNGESIRKLIRSIAILWFLMTIFHMSNFRLDYNILNIFDSLIRTPGIFLGYNMPSSYPVAYVSVISIIRLVSLGLVVSIIVKRFNRR